MRDGFWAAAEAALDVGLGADAMDRPAPLVWLRAVTSPKAILLALCCC